MKLGYGWLKEFVPGLPPVEDTARRLGAAGLAVASVRPFSSRLSGVIVAEILAVEKHPNADRLRLCDVDAGGERHRIVCGAANVRPGMKAPLALPGARLPGGKEIGRAVIRGVASEGMLCSPAEVGVAGDAGGLLELDAGAVPGEPFVPEPEEHVLEIEVTPNRGDALSTLGVARQLAAVLGVPWALPWKAAQESSAAAGDAGWSVATEDPAGCGLYTARLLEGVRVGPSPDWLQRRLAACGMRPINNVVDVTNYVMLELGQPLHAFDLARLKGRRVAARAARAGETLKTLDGQGRALPAGALVIADEGGPVAVAGVMGGAGSEITAETTAILLEAAWFDPVRVRKAARALGLSTESSYRFERGVDPGGVARASARAAQLLMELAGGRPASAPLEARGRLPAPAPITVEAGATSSLLGVALTGAEIGALCARLGCDAAVEGGTVRVTPPSWRPDLTLPADVAEECAILLGYDRIPATAPAVRAAPPGRAKSARAEERLRAALRGAGCSEARTLSFMRAADLARLDPAGAGAAVKLLNPMSEDEDFLRTTLLAGLARSASYNLAREAPGVALFELGTVFAADGDGPPREHARLGLLVAGREPQTVHGPERTLDFYDLKGALDAAGTSLGIALGWEPGLDPRCGPGAAARVLAGNAVVGSAGVLLPALADAYELPRGACVAEVDLLPLYAAAVLDAPAAAPARHPAIRRDLAVVAPETVTAGALEAAARKAGGALLEQAAVFDVYRGKPVPAGAKSLALRLAFRAPDRTLTEAEAEPALAAILKALEAEFGATLRAA